MNVVMRQNRIPSDESIRSSCASSSSGCISEQSSVASTPSNGNSTVYESSSVTHPNSNVNSYNNSSLKAQAITHSNSPVHGSASSASLNAFDADYSGGTIKRKPSVSIMQPKIPLTNTTRNLALQSDDALLEVDNDTEHQACLAMSYSNEDEYGNNSIYSPFKSGTSLRRSNADFTKPSNVGKIYDRNAMQTNSSLHLQSSLSHYATSQSPVKSDSDDELPPPPPPLPDVLKEGDSSLSLNQFPPPPPVITEDANQSFNVANQPHSISMSSLTDGNNQQQVNQEQRSPTLPGHYHFVPMTPQPQPKQFHRLSRRSSDLSSNSQLFMSHRHNSIQQSVDFLTKIEPSSRASIASSSESTYAGFATLKSYHTVNNRNMSKFQRQMTLDLHSINKYSTSPRVRGGLEFNQMLTHEPFNKGNQIHNVHESHNMNYRSPPSSQQKLMVSGIPNNLGSHQTVNNSHCNLISPSSQTDSIVSNHQIYFSQTQVPPMPPPPLPIQKNHTHQKNENGYSVSSPIHPQIPSSQFKEENHYMSISPHLLQKHQQMQQRQHQQMVSPPTMPQFFIRHHNHQLQSQQPPCGTNNVPEESFLKNMEKVMQKKWHVAQRLQQDQTATPSQVLGFRDSAYLPPPPPQAFNQTQQFADATNQFSLTPNGQQLMTQQPQYDSYSGYCTESTPLPFPPPPHHIQAPDNNSAYRATKSVRITDQPTIMSSLQVCDGHKRIPPPPPKRSETTQLSINKQ